MRSECATGVSGSVSFLPQLFEKVETHCVTAVKNTPSQLSVLKDAGVVDSGGAGIVCIFKGFVNYFNGERR